MTLLNVRLDAEDARRAAALKRAGVQLSRIVREAIRAEHTRRLGSERAGRAARDIMAQIYADCPACPPGPTRSVTATLPGAPLCASSAKAGRDPARHHDVDSPTHTVIIRAILYKGNKTTQEIL